MELFLVKNPTFNLLYLAERLNIFLLVIFDKSNFVQVEEHINAFQQAQLFALR